jgi:hypothetical protein
LAASALAILLALPLLSAAAENDGFRDGFEQGRRWENGSQGKVYGNTSYSDWPTIPALVNSSAWPLWFMRNKLGVGIPGQAGHSWAGYLTKGGLWKPAFLLFK